MKDIPMFTTEYGIASLILREVPYQKKAYISIWATQEPELLLKECVDFCRMVGSEQINATGHAGLEVYPLYTSILQMQCSVDRLTGEEGALWPLQVAGIPKFL